MRDLRPPTENRTGIKIITTLAIMRGDEDDKTRETDDTDLPQAQLLLCRTQTDGHGNAKEEQRVYSAIKTT